MTKREQIVLQKELTAKGWNFYKLSKRKNGISLTNGYKAERNGVEIQEPSMAKLLKTVNER